MPYSSSLTDKEWEIISPLLSQKKKTRPPRWTKRQILDGIFYQLKNGCNWCDLPKDLPPYSTVFWHYKQWRSDGVLDQIMATLHAKVRQQVKKKPKWTRLLIIDSQAVKNTCNASVKSKGFCHYKCTNGIKRHLAIDTLGLPFFTHCTPASMPDDQGLIELLSNHLDYFRAKPVNIPKITILLDHGYHPNKIAKALQQVYPQLMTKIRLELAPKPTKVAKAAQGKTGFVVVATRWIVERSNAWMERSPEFG
jgi:transposase